MHSVIRPKSWVALKLPSGITRVIQITPNTTISLGKYGSFPANLILDRPYHLTFEILDKREGESFSRLRVVPPEELYGEIFADEDSPECATPTANNAGDGDGATTNGEAEVTATTAPSLIDPETGKVDAKKVLADLDENARQTLTQDEIEELKREGNNAGKDVIAKLMASHTAIDKKTSFSLAKYKLLKQKKYMRRFQVLPVDVTNLASWQLEERDASKILDMRAEMMGLVGCWANVHYGGEDVYLPDPLAQTNQGAEATVPVQPELLKGRWLVVDDTCGVLTAAMAERMGILYPEEEEDEKEDDKMEEKNAEEKAQEEKGPDMVELLGIAVPEPEPEPTPPRPTRASDFVIPYSQTNTITVIHGASQPNLSFLNYFGFDVTSPNHPPHPLLNHLLTLTWLQLVKPELDNSYATPPLVATHQTLTTWKPSRRGNFHRKRRRYARIRHIVDTARTGNFSGLVCASTMDPISILKHTLPLLAGGAPVAIYSPTIESLSALADCFSVSRRTAWTSGSVPETAGKTAEELEHWPGTPDFPLNPTLLLGTSIQTSRARRWQVLPGRTHPLMTERGGAEGYVFTAFRAKPAEGRVEAKGKHKRKRTEAPSKPATVVSTGRTDGTEPETVSAPATMVDTEMADA